MYSAVLPYLSLQEGTTYFKSSFANLEHMMLNIFYTDQASYEKQCTGRVLVIMVETMSEDSRVTMTFLHPSTTFRAKGYRL